MIQVNVNDPDMVHRGASETLTDGTDRGYWMQTVSGHRYYPHDPSPYDVRIGDIAHHLSLINRYTGATLFPYSVAEHSLLVSYVVERYAPEHALVALMHDATEAYLTDLNRPVKSGLPAYKALEQKNWERAVAPAFGLPHVIPDIVHAADTAILYYEKTRLLKQTPETQWLPITGAAAEIETNWLDRLGGPGLDWQSARDLFEARFHKLERDMANGR